MQGTVLRSPPLVMLNVSSVSFITPTNQLLRKPSPDPPRGALQHKALHSAVLSTQHVTKESSANLALWI